MSASTSAEKPAADKAAAAAADQTKEVEDPTANLSPEEIIKKSVAIKKRLDELEREKKEAEERAQKAEKVIKKFADEEERKRKEYAEKHAADAEAVTEHMLEILAEQGLNPEDITDEWKHANKLMLTSDDNVGRQAQAIQVSCSRGYRAMKARVLELEARNGELEKAVKLGQAVLDVEDDDIERHERRDLKAAARNTAAAAPAAGGMVAPDTETAVEPPAWLRAMTGGDRYLNSPYRMPTAEAPMQQRQLTAAAAAPARKAAPQAAPAPRQKKNVAAAAAQPQQQQQQPQGPRPLRAGYPVNEFAMRNSEYNRALWDFTAKLVPTTSTNNALAPIAGADFERREGM